LSSTEVLRRLHGAGFEVVSQRGSHVKLRGRGGRTVVVKHPDRDVPPGTLHAILRQAGLTRAEFDDL
jgi:predicted RNA binding protein YcfA (HicA-like mRNA interferase family)